MTEIKNISVRVYGIVIKKGELLLSEEKWHGREMLKFPGGGVEFGESPIEALKREFNEELQTEIVSYKLLHVSEEFVESMFVKETQVISIYYTVEIANEPFYAPVSSFKKELTDGEQRFRKELLSEFDVKQLSFPSDQQVAKLLVKS